MPAPGPLSIAAHSHMGRVRKNNEDRVATDADLGLLVLADGMGGHNAGEVASRLAVDVVQNTVNATLGGGRSLPQPATGYSAEAELLRDAVRLAHGAILRAAQAKPIFQGMGTTLIACLLQGDRLVAAHVGDSRLYRLREGVLEQITQDHSLVGEMVARGFYTQAEAQAQVRKNVITRALGGEHEVLEVDLLEEPLQTDDIYLLCSDGLTDMASDAQINVVLRAYAANVDKAATALIELALKGGGKDNVSVILARVNQVTAEHKSLWKTLSNWF
ncbi:MAG: Stp1/IreP family PP2C-type Ser/Thr phosphatase [Nevskiales bacterium]